MSYWQVGAGDGKRNYFKDVFLEFGVMVIGPGDPAEPVNKNGTPSHRI